MSIDEFNIAVQAYGEANGAKKLMSRNDLLDLIGK